MYTLTVMDKDAFGLLSIGLLDLIGVLRPYISDLEWTVSGLEVSGPGAEALYEVEKRGERMSTARVESFAGRLDQVIDGAFAAYQRGAGSPFLELRAVDSSSWDVSTDERSILERVRRAFVNVYDAGNIG